MGESYTDVARKIRARYNQFAQEFAFKEDSREWVRPLIQRFSDVVPYPRLVLDLGCAGGRETVELGEAGMRVIGLDLAREALRIAVNARPAHGYVEGDMTRLPFASGSLDGVWASASMLHLPPDVAPIALAEVARVLRPGGGLYATVQRGATKGWRQPLPGQAVRAELYYAHYQPDEWRGIVEAAGFEVVTFNVKEDIASCNAAATGWIEVTARKPGSGATG
jgi:SAM-dependent methyltransferase